MKMLDVKSVFLQGEFTEDQEQVYLEILQGFEHIYKQLGDELKSGKIPSEKVLERAIEIHNEWCKDP